jgi:NADPH-dependent curcumin reductase CurA
MRELLENLLRSLPSASLKEMESIEAELLEAAEGGPESIDEYFESVAKELVDEARALANRVDALIGGA